ncbi:MAG: right-handed parallel beta-helix repeat-containing protein, partial [Actinobacteria bacterium]|nr:right-handed parallel beta-helix repeat-containing protein [Actinomycetota bacterium]
MLSASALALGGMAYMAQPAAAAVRTISCGQTISGNVTAANNVGPCSNGDAIKINASGTVLNLGGHSIRCNNANNHTRVAQVGIHLKGASGVTVRNGEVSNCDAGVAIDGGGNNTVQGINAHDNVAHVLVAGPVNPDNPLTTPCDFGDGIVTTDSSGNTISGNTVTRNGPFSGIALVGNSDNNKVIGNQANNQNVSNALPGVVDPETGEPVNGPCGPFGANGAGAGRLHQDIGIRVEGPGATNNTVSGNQTIGNQLNGISVHGYVCHSFPGGPPIGADNSGTQIIGNSVSGNGFPDGLDGIGVLSQGPLGTITCGSSHATIRGNSSTGNAEDGIYVTPTGDNSKPSKNIIDHNSVDGNARDGIHLEGPFDACPFGQESCDDALLQPRNGANFNTITGNSGNGNANYDGFDGNPGCD